MALNGCWDQIRSLVRAFDELEGYRIEIRNGIEYGEINILIEEGNLVLAREMKRIKEKYPSTRYILLVTEYLTLTAGYRQLNCFTLRESLVRSIIGCLRRLLVVDDGCNWRGKKSLASRSLYMVPRLASFLFRKSLGQDAFINHVMLSRRMDCLRATRNLYDLCFGSSAAVLETYRNYFVCESVYVPIVVDGELFRKQARKIVDSGRGFVGCGFNGRMTRYRKSVLNKLDRNAACYPLMDLLTREGDSQKAAKDEIGAYMVEIGQASSVFYQSPDARKIKVYPRIGDMRTSETVPMFDVYIPQAREWKFSSPNRTYLSLRMGLIPVNLGRFSDHDINCIAFECSTEEELEELLVRYRKRDIHDLIDEVSLNIDDYNRKQLGLCRRIGNKLDIMKKR